MSKILRFVSIASWPAAYGIGDIASFDTATANTLITQGVAVDHQWDSMGPGGTPLVDPAMNGQVPSQRAEGAPSGWAFKPPAGLQL